MSNSKKSHETANGSNGQMINLDQYICLLLSFFVPFFQKNTSKGEINMIDLKSLPKNVQEIMSDNLNFLSQEALEEAAWKEVKTTLSGNISNLPKQEQLYLWREAYVKTLTQKTVDNNNLHGDNKSVLKKIKHSVPAYIAARIVMEVYTTIRLNVSSDLDTTSASVFLPAIYDEDRGIYDYSDDAFLAPLKFLRPNAAKNDLTTMREDIALGSPRRNRTGLVGREHDLIPFKNGILDYKTKQLLPFSPDYVFVWQLNCDWDPNAVDVPYTTRTGKTYTFETWLDEITAEPAAQDADDDNPSSVQFVPCAENKLLIKQLLGSIARPFVDWQQSVWLYSPAGSGGKGSILSLCRRLLGNRHIDLNLDDMTGKKSDFVFEKALMDCVVAVLGDENPVGIYIDDSANAKAIISHDDIRINRKGREMIYAALYVVMIQCLNELPRMRDISQSNLRRQLPVRFYQHYTGSEKDTGIKDRWFSDPALLSYIMKACLMDIPDYYEYTETENVRRTKQSMVEQNSPVKRFVMEVLNTAPDEYPRLPFPILYTLYKSWYRVNVPDKQCMSDSAFRRELEEALRRNEYWQYEDRKSFNATPAFINRMGLVHWDAIDRYDCRDLMPKNSSGYINPDNRDLLGVLAWREGGYKGGIWRVKKCGISGAGYEMSVSTAEPEPDPVQSAAPARTPVGDGNPNPYTPDTLVATLAKDGRIDDNGCLKQ